VRQPPLFVAAPLAASAVPIRRPGQCEERRELRQVLSQVARRIHGGFQRTDGAPTPFQRWRERPHRWPRAWQAKRPFRVVASRHCCPEVRGRLQVSDSGRHRSPPGQRGLKPRAGNDFSSRLKYRAPDAKPSSKEAHRHRVGGTPRARPCSPSCSPLDGPHAEPSIGDGVQRLT
jgi:hypothetical protein